MTMWKMDCRVHVWFNGYATPFSLRFWRSRPEAKSLYSNQKSHLSEIFDLLALPQQVLSTPYPCHQFTAVYSKMHKSTPRRQMHTSTPPQQMRTSTLPQQVPSRVQFVINSWSAEKRKHEFHSNLLMVSRRDTWLEWLDLLPADHVRVAKTVAFLKVSNINRSILYNLHFRYASA